MTWLLNELIELTGFVLVLSGILWDRARRRHGRRRAVEPWAIGMLGWVLLAVGVLLDGSELMGLLVGGGLGTAACGWEHVHHHTVDGPLLTSTGLWCRAAGHHPLSHWRVPYSQGTADATIGGTIDGTALAPGTADLEGIREALAQQTPGSEFGMPELVGWECGRCGATL